MSQRRRPGKAQRDRMRGTEQERHAKELAAERRRAEQRERDDAERTRRRLPQRLRERYQ